MSYKNTAYCLKFTLVASFVLLCLIGKSQIDVSGLQKFFTDNQKALGNDVVALVVRDGKIAFKKEMGDFTIKTKIPVGSSSKWLTAALVMTFVDEGKISLDDKVSKYLPDFAKYVKPDITIRQCLSHETGIEDNTNGVSRLFERHKYASLDLEVTSFAQRGISAKPGKLFIYGNMGPDIAGSVVEAVSKKKFDVVMKEKIFVPLGMKNSSFTPEDNAVNPSGGAVCSVADYLVFLQMLLDKGKFMDKQILSEASVNQMQSVQTTDVPKKYVPKDMEGYEYGLGEWIESSDGQGNSQVISGAGLFDTWPYIDKCRNYACMLFIKSGSDEQKKALYLAFQKTISQQIPAVCK